MTKKTTLSVVYSIFMVTIAILFTACSDKDKTDDNGLSQSQVRLVGKWECTMDSYGDPWDEPLIMMFDSDGTGYQWFSDEPFSNRWKFNYVATSSKIKIETQYETYELEYEISSNNKTLILYNWDGDDMEELWFTRVNSEDPSDKEDNSIKEDDKDNTGNNDDSNNPASSYITTESKIFLNPMTATLYGFLRGVTKDTEVGFFLSLSPEMKKSDCRKITLSSSGGRFDTLVNGILDQETYYYQAYANIDGKYYYGEILSFHTDPLTYTVNGKEYKVIKVEGGPYGDFSILQTEISATDRIVFGGIDLEITLDCDKIDGNISLYEAKKFIVNLLKKTGYAWRYPTSYEWQFAAEGGLKSKNFIYSGSDDIESVAWYNENSIGPRESGLKMANELGLYDMSGNFAELTNDIPLKYLETHTYLQAEYYDLNKSQAYGGCWKDNASKCKTNSHESTQWIEKNLIDGRKCAFRFVYSHHIQSFYE